MFIYKVTKYVLFLMLWTTKIEKIKVSRQNLQAESMYINGYDYGQVCCRKEPNINYLNIY